jgi:putative ABC transport system substrate-binding protein
MSEATMTRRTVGFIVTLALSLLVAPLAAEAQPAGKVPRLGVLVPAEPPSPEEPHLAAFHQALSHLGYVAGQTVAIEYRYALGRQERFPELVGELVGLPVDLLVVGSSPAAVAAKQATRAIPIVFLGGGDPVRSGLVASLARPGGNVTGLTNMAWETAGKRLALFKESVPTLVRVAALYDAANPENLRHVQEVQAAGRALGVTVQLWEVRGTDDFERVFAALHEERPEGLYVPGGPLMRAHEQRIVAVALKSGIPSAHDSREAVEGGGLMSYAYAIGDQYRRAAAYVDKILKGAKPADLPVEQPTPFELVINPNMAKTSFTVVGN